MATDVAHQHDSPDLGHLPPAQGHTEKVVDIRQGNNLTDRKLERQKSRAQPPLHTLQCLDKFPLPPQPWVQTLLTAASLQQCGLSF